MPRGPYLVDDVVPAPLRGEPEPVLEAAGALLDQRVPLSLVVLLPRFTIDLSAKSK